MLTCHVLLVIGTSGVVAPVSDLPLLAKQVGAKIIEINTQRTPLTSLADLLILGTAATVMQRIWQCIQVMR